MASYHTLKVKDIINETSDALSIVLDVPDSLKDQYGFIQGQYLSFRKTINEESLVRAYSLCSAPYEGEWKVTVKRIENGKFSTYATTKLSIGDELEVMLPEGNFSTTIKSTQKKNYIAFAAGSGITPIMSILKEVLHREKESTFTLFFGNKKEDSIIYRNELNELMTNSNGRFTVHYILSQEDNIPTMFSGRLNAEKCDTFSSKLFDITTIDDVFLCGPQTMVESIKTYFENNNIDSKSIHYELFYVDQVSVENVETNTNFKEANITLIIDGDEFEFKCPTDKYVLDVAIEQDLDVPFSCKSGVCCTCKAKVMSGEVTMVNNYALEEDEVADGYVLTCQSLPQSENVVLDMDE